MSDLPLICAHSRIRGIPRKGQKPKRAGLAQQDYLCEAKYVFATLLPPQVGCWKTECENASCERYPECHSTETSDWCYQGLKYTARREENLTCNCLTCATDCPLFKPRTKKDFIKRVDRGKLPLFTSGFRVAPQIKSAMRTIGFSEELIAYVSNPDIDVDKRYRKFCKSGSEPNENY